MNLEEAIGQYTAYAEADITATMTAREAEQLAEWLRELKVVRESWLELTSTVVEVAENTENKDIEGFAKFLVNYLGVLEKHIMEVKADDD